MFGSAGCGKSTLLRALAGRRGEDAGGGAAGAPGGPGGAASGAGGPGTPYAGRSTGTPPLTALANVQCDDDMVRTLALVEVGRGLRVAGEVWRGG